MDNEENEFEKEELNEEENDEVIEAEEVEEEKVPVTTISEESNEEDDSEKIRKEKRTIIIICVAVVASLIILTLIIALLMGRGDKDKDKNNNGAPTNDITSNTSAVTVKIIFDADGGEPVDSMEVNENETIVLPTTTKNGYKLEGWYLDDKRVDNTTTYDKDTVLKAKWIKQEYTCPDGYTLKDKTCTISKTATASCTNGTKENGEYCVSLTDYKKATKKCKKTTLDGVEYEGTIFEREDETVCAYAPVDNVTTDEECGNQGNKWMVNKCYKHTVTNSDDYSVSCEKGYNYLSKDDLKNKFNVTNMTDGCYKQTSKTYSCEKDFTLSGKSCTKTVEATIKE